MALLMRVAALFLLTACSVDNSRPGNRPLNILLVVIDTLRADALGVYGSSWNATPFLDAFAREATLFQNAFAPTPMTAPSHASLFTSTHPASHGIWNEVHLDREKSVIPKLPPSAITLAEVLNDAGYETAAFADGGWVIPARGFDQGFDRFESETRGVADRVRSATDWLERRDSDRPFFLFLHTYEVHAPYLPPQRYEDAFDAEYDGPLREVLLEARAFAASGAVENKLVDVHERFFKPILAELDSEDLRFLRALYQAELALVDEHLAQLVEYLRRSGILDETVVVVTSDHGEEFGEHGQFGHGQVYDELLRIPLLIRTPGAPAGERAEPVTLVDIMPTLLSHVGVEIPASAVGHAVNLEEGGSPKDRLLVAEMLWRRKRQLAVQLGAMKAVFFYGYPGGPHPAQVFDSSVDPEEQHSISSSQVGAEFLKRSQGVLQTWFEEARRHRQEHDLHRLERSLDDFEERMEELRALGYVAQ
jgi:arylsulfatase A-like enzyme